MTIKAVVVPDIGADSADVIEILVKPGQRVAVDDPIAVLESDKASMEIPCPWAGVVKEIKVSIGQPAKQDDVLLMLETAAEAAAATPAPAPAVPVAEIAQELKQVSTVLTPAGADTGTVVVRVPDIGSDEADVIEILVRVGDTIALEQSLVVLESAKASMEVPSSAAGVVSKLLVKIGDKVGEGGALLELQVAGTSTSTKQVASAPAVTPVITGTPAPAPAPKPAATGPVPAAAPADSVDVHAGPAVRRLARELGVSLVRVSGTGPKSRILKEDVHAFVKKAMTEGIAAPAATGNGLPPLPEIDFAKFGEIELRPLTKIQKLSAQNLHRAWVHIPHVTQFDEADITELDAFRVAQKEALKARGVNLTILAFLVKASAHVLKQMPKFNTSLSRDGENLIWKKYIHIGVAVDTPNGLVVPVIRDADRKSVSDIARDLGELSAKAREKKLMPADMQGATFSISSLGGIGGTAFTPIVNWPEVAILGVSRSSQKPVWDGKSFQPRLTLPLSLSYDHRVIDGADAARFTSTLSKVLADIRQLLL